MAFERLGLWFARREVKKRLLAWIEKGTGAPLTKEEKRMFGITWNNLRGNWRTTLWGAVEGFVTSIVYAHATAGSTWGGAFHSALVALPAIIRGLVSKDAAVGSKAV